MSDSTSLAETLMAKHGVNEEPNGHAEEVVDNIADVSVASDGGEGSGNGDGSDETLLTSANSSIVSNGKFDIESLDAFPTLGSSTPVAKQVASSWGSSTSGSSTPSGVSPKVKNVSAVRSGSITENLTLLSSEQSPKARNILSEVLTKVRKSSGTSIDSSTSRSSGNTTFIIRGSPENVQKAKRELMKALAVKVTKTIQIPASLRSFVIGPKGSTLRPIIEETGAQIDISKREGKDEKEKVEDGDEDEETVNVTIEGDKQGILLAEKRILDIVSSKVREITSKIQNVDRKYFPFIEKEIELEGLNKDIKVTFNKNNGVIVLFGERNLVLERKSKIESIINDEKESFVSSFITVPEVKSKFIPIDYVFENSGASAIISSGSSNIELFGPAENISKAKTIISKYISDLSILSLDISKAHDKSISHGRNLTRYFIASGKLNEIERVNKVKISTPSLKSLYEEEPTSINYEIVGNDNELIKVSKKSLVSLVNSFPPSSIKVVSDIDEFFYSFVEKLAKEIKKEDFVDVVVSKGNKEILLVYVGNPNDDEDFAIGPSEIEKILEKVDGKFNEIRSKQTNIISKSIEIDHENHKFISGPNNTTLNAIIKGGKEHESFISILIGIGKDGISKEKNSIFVRGVKSEVDRVIKEINQVIEESKNYEILSSYTTNFTFPVEHINKLIGKQGTHLSKLIEEFAVKIDVDEQGNGIIKGIKKNADEAKTRILNLGRKWGDEVSIKLSIPNEYHATIIGQGGKFVKRLMQRYDVYIHFPRVGAGEDKEGKEGSKEGTPTPTPSKDSLNPNQILIRGPSNGVQKTKDEIEELVKYEADHSFTNSIIVPANTLPRIIGRQGEIINEIKESTNTRIDVKDEEDREKPSSDRNRSVSIEIIGTKTGVKSAAEKIQQIVQEIVDTIETEIEVDPKYHGALIGPGGSVRREIITKAGGSPESNRTIQIPPADSNNNKIKVSGNRKVVDKIIKQIKEIIDAKENQITDTIDVNPERHGALIGPGGIIKREIESTYNVILLIPRKGAKKSDGSIDEGIKIVGNNKSEIEQAKTRIQELTQETFQIEIQVPKHLHAELSNRGTYIRKLFQDYGVKIDHGKSNSSAPKVPAIPLPPKEAFGELTNGSEDSGALRYKFTIIPEGIKTTATSTSTIVWRLKGDDVGCTKAQKEIENTIKELEKHDSYAYFWLADPTKYGALIGPQGSRINSIRSKSGCTIIIPQADSQNPIISLRGSTEQLEQAKDLIVKSLAGK